MKTNLVATNATMNVLPAVAQKELTGTNSGQTDALLKMFNATNANAIAAAIRTKDAEKVYK